MRMDEQAGARGHVPRANAPVSHTWRVSRQMHHFAATLSHHLRCREGRRDDRQAGPCANMEAQRVATHTALGQARLTPRLAERCFKPVAGTQRGALSWTIDATYEYVCHTRDTVNKLRVAGWRTHSRNSSPLRDRW